jgi:hypothetical protein
MRISWMREIERAEQLSSAEAMARNMFSIRLKVTSPQLKIILPRVPWLKYVRRRVVRKRQALVVSLFMFNQLFLLAYPLSK